MRKSAAVLVVTYALLAACTRGSGIDGANANSAQTCPGCGPDGGKASGGAAPTCSASGLANVWALSSLDRLAPDAPAADTSSIELWAGRGEYESLQIAIQGPAGGLSGASVEASDFVAGGQVIPAASVRLF